ncbi:hypothetical protein OROMI_021386 [Orobanche minor]
MVKSLEIGRSYACGQGAAVAIGKSLEIGRAYACGQGVAYCHGKITRNWSCLCLWPRCCCCHREIT